MVPTTDPEQTPCLAPSASVLPRAGSGGVSTRQLYLGKEVAGIHRPLQPQHKGKQALALRGGRQAHPLRRAGLPVTQESPLIRKLTGDPSSTIQLRKGMMGLPVSGKLQNKNCGTANTG